MEITENNYIECIESINEYISGALGVKKADLNLIDYNAETRSKLDPTSITGELYKKLTMAYVQLNFSYKIENITYQIILAGTGYDDKLTASLSMDSIL